MSLREGRPTASVKPKRGVEPYIPEEQVFSGSDVHVARILSHGRIADLGFGNSKTVITELGVLDRLICDVTP